LPFKYGIPSHDQFGILFSRLDPEALQDSFTNWIASLLDMLEGVVAVDGKTLRRSFDTKSNTAATHMISAWSCERKLVLGQRMVDDRSNEITAIPKLLEMLALEGATVTIDAMGCQRKICQQIINKEADYVIGLKSNQGSLHEGVELFFEEHLDRGIGGALLRKSETMDAGHGRFETRRHTVCTDIVVGQTPSLAGPEGRHHDRVHAWDQRQGEKDTPFLHLINCQRCGKDGRSHPKPLAGGKLPALGSGRHFPTGRLPH